MNTSFIQNGYICASVLLAVSALGIVKVLDSNEKTFFNAISADVLAGTVGRHPGGHTRLRREC